MNQDLHRLEVANSIIIDIFQIKTLLLEQGDALVAPIGLTSARWQVLGAIARSSVPMTVPMIADAMGNSRQGVQKQVNQMLAEGLCQLQANPQRQRSGFVALTDKGRAAFAEAMALSNKWVAALIDTLTTADMEGALAVLHALRQQLQATPLKGVAS